MNPAVRSAAHRIEPARDRRPSVAAPRHLRGLTLIELIIGIALASILMVVAVPSYTTILSRLRLTSHSNELSSSLAFARSEALRRGVRVTVCKSASATACATSGTWASGWLVFVDNRHLSGNVAGVVDGSGGSADEILRAVPALTGSTVTASTSFADWVGFRPDGVSVGSSGTASGSLTVCHGSQGVAQAVNALGRTQTSKVTC
jgi:type IV fimbrial biogenesis protein FimT